MLNTITTIRELRPKKLIIYFSGTFSEIDADNFLKKNFLLKQCLE